MTNHSAPSLLVALVLFTWTGACTCAVREPRPVVVGWQDPVFNPYGLPQLTVVDPFGSTNDTMVIYSDPNPVNTTSLPFFAVSGGPCPAECSAHPLRQDPQDPARLQVGVVPPGMNATLLTWVAVPNCDASTVHAFIGAAPAYARGQQLVLVCSAAPAAGSPLNLVLLDPRTLAVTGTTRITTETGSPLPHDPRATYRYAVPTSDGLLLYRVANSSPTTGAADSRLLVKVTGTRVTATADFGSTVTRMGTWLNPEDGEEIGYAIVHCLYDGNRCTKPVLRFNTTTLQNVTSMGLLHVQQPYGASMEPDFSDPTLLFIEPDLSFSTYCYAENGWSNDPPGISGFCRGSLLEPNASRVYKYPHNYLFFPYGGFGLA